MPKPEKPLEKRRRQTRAESETNTEDNSECPPNEPGTPKNKTIAGGKGKDETSTSSTSSQLKIDSLFKTTETDATCDIASMLKTLQNKLDKVASQEFIESEFKKLVTQELLTEKLDAIKEELKCHMNNEIKSVYNTIEEVKKIAEKAERRAEELEGNMFDVNNSLEKMEENNLKLVSENRKLREELNGMDYKAGLQCNELNDLQQYTRRNSIRMYGLDDPDRKESYNETAVKVLRVLNDRLGMRIKESDIDIAHRLGTFMTDGNRPVICKFVCRTHKIEAITQRRKLKGSPVVIREDLTAKNAKLLEKVSALEEVQSAWTVEGRIYALLQTETKVRVTHFTDLSKPLEPAKK